MTYAHQYDAFYHSQAWKKVRLQALKRDYYLCQICKRRGVIKQADTVDHVIPLREAWDKRLDLNNLQSICHECHNRKHFEKGLSNFKRSLYYSRKRKKDVVIFKKNPDIF